jgi:hypothetical protein
VDIFVQFIQARLFMRLPESCHQFQLSSSKLKLRKKEEEGELPLNVMNLLPNPYGVKIYNVSVGKSLPEWISEKKKKSLQKDEGSLELIIVVIV